MKLENPKTKEIFEVEEAHGQMLLSQGFYKEAKKTVSIEEESPVVKKKAGRPRKSTK